MHYDGYSFTSLEYHAPQQSPSLCLHHEISMFMMKLTNQVSQQSDIMIMLGSFQSMKLSIQQWGIMDGVERDQKGKGREFISRLSPIEQVCGTEEDFFFDPLYKTASPKRLFLAICAAPDAILENVRNQRRIPISCASCVKYGKDKLLLLYCHKIDDCSKFSVHSFWCFQ